MDGILVSFEGEAKPNQIKFRERSYLIKYGRSDDRPGAEYCLVLTCSLLHRKHSKDNHFEPRSG